MNSEERNPELQNHPAQYPMTPAKWREKEAKRLRTALIVETAILLVMGVLVLMLLVSMAGTYAMTPSPRVRAEVVRPGDPMASIAIVPVSGVLYTGAPGGMSRGSADWVVEALSNVSSDERVRAVVLEIDSPGGSVAAADLIHRELERIRRGGKKVVALLGTLAASGGYYVASGADRIIALPTTITGSIGVILQTFRVDGLLSKLGVQPVTVKAGKYKDMASPFREMSDDELKMLQSMAEEVHERFVSVVANGRNLPREKVLELADGRIFTATQAKAAGLVDEMGYLDDAVASAEKLAGISKATVLRYRHVPSLVELFMLRMKPLDIAQGFSDTFVYLADDVPLPMFVYRPGR